ncbi:hypothetical protein JW926_10460, partial [Candidatus Sumerlaeota bacterium]|nr:hypothetical protein [Candidatus Sumerlaeota bacterium]
RLVPNHHVLITQRKPSDDTSQIQIIAPKTWDYLKAHSDILDKRKSIIYQNRPRFSIFGVGDYTFTPWKVAISGLYKNCRFCVVGNSQGKPIVLDDTCYFIPCDSEQESRDFFSQTDDFRLQQALLVFEKKARYKIKSTKRQCK